MRGWAFARVLSLAVVGYLLMGLATYVALGVLTGAPELRLPGWPPWPPWGHLTWIMAALLGVIAGLRRWVR